MTHLRLAPALLLLALAMLAAGCGGEAAHDGPLARDSAGIEVVENLEARWTRETAWRVDPEPVVEVGLVEGDPEYLFSNVEAARLLDDGRIAVADRGSAQVRFFDREGRFLAAFGREGGGPGEFEYLRDLKLCGGDSLFVFDIHQNAAVVGPNGSYVREVWPYDPLDPVRRPYQLDCARNGRFVAIGWERREGPPPIGFHRAEAPAWILAPASGWSANVGDHARAVEPDAVAAVDTFPGGLTVVAELGTFLSSERIGTASGSRPHPFGRATAMAIDEEAIYLGSGEAAEVRRYSPTGDLVGLVRWPAPDLEIRPEDVEAYRQEQLSTLREATRPAFERWLRDLPLPERFPAYIRLELDPGHHLWLEQFRRPGTAERRWLVIAPDGALLGDVALPPDFEVMDIGRNEIVGVARDELGVERVRLYRLLKAG